MPVLPTYEDVLKAAERLEGNAIKTKLIRSDAIDAMMGKTVWFKPECNQKVGAFKYRGGYNRLSAMTATERATEIWQHNLREFEAPPTGGGQVVERLRLYIEKMSKAGGAAPVE